MDETTAQDEYAEFIRRIRDGRRGGGGGARQAL